MSFHSAKLLGLSAALLMSASAYADTYIYITNSTPEPVQIEVQHSATAAPLKQGSEWQQEVTEIEPYATARVLHFNRYWGVKSGQTYQFDTKISVSGEVITAQQSMTGTWIGSDIYHSATGADFNAPWAFDREIHRQDTNYQLKPTTVAYKATFTGGYDDIYYTITPKTQPEPQEANTLKVLTYNTFALPLIASDIDVRLGEMPEHLKGYDAIMFQELFSSSSPSFLRALSKEYPYQTEILKNKNGINLHNGGVAIVSRYPIAQADYFVYPGCTGTDCFADKGFVRAEIIKDGQAYNLVGTHTASFDTQAARDLRQEQFQQMRQHIENAQVPAFDAVLYGGDFNINKLIFPEDYQGAYTNLNATVPVSTGNTRTTFDTDHNYYAAVWDHIEYLDYIMWSNAHRTPETSRNDVRVPRSVSNNLWGKWDLSDHYPVMGEFKFAD